MVSLSPHEWMNSEASGGSEPTATAGVASETSAGLNGSTAGDARLGLLVSFLSPACKITHDFLLRAGSPRKRWTLHGGVEEVDATAAGLATELTGLLSDSPRLSNALSSLSLALLKESDQGYTLDMDAVNIIHRDLPTEALVFWKTQALIVSYRACPWKHIESRSVLIWVFEKPPSRLLTAAFSNLDMSSVLQHLQYATHLYGGCLESLRPATQADFILTVDRSIVNSEGHVTSTGPHYKVLSPCRRGFATPFEATTNPTSRLNGIPIWSAFSYLFANISFLSYTIKPNQHLHFWKPPRLLQPCKM